MHVCKTLSTPIENELQTCTEWTTFEVIDLFQSLAITKIQMIQIGASLIAVAACFIAFAVIAKAVNQL
ncbi:hypothetical protein VXG46_000097 [Acinetobacter baumannii]|uniref:Putative membrane protein n=1 Tax=Acinetobacter baumannii TaxID=470 RepID=A0A505M990_ACIBA|nr:hypothetical protein [Acinetobacter baumannii]EJB8494395.1 hypothetical protein [Acinetobacter baumannii]ELB0343130.1 hypothetical protein [Acinetobacter baumannii]EMC7949647.1 hypothetical protein [Acinetobacter baumannii]EMD9691001.1 hypothetical protein [Acinetobacter baumannii]KCY18922.1 hypothetical protein J635_4127 [Acinetobacter baumannii 233846]